jgi:hypothetical protein
VKPLAHGGSIGCDPQLVKHVVRLELSEPAVAFCRGRQSPVGGQDAGVERSRQREIHGVVRRERSAQRPEVARERRYPEPHEAHAAGRARDAVRDEFDPPRLIDECATLFLHAPDGDQEALAPIFGALLGAVLHLTEERAAATGQPGGALLRILVAEAAHLAPLQKLPYVPAHHRLARRPGQRLC